MKNFRKVLPKVSLGIAMIMMLMIPAMPVYSFVGNYESNSQALSANASQSATLAEDQEAAWPLAVAAGVVLGVVFVVGVVDGWNSHHDVALTANNFDANYNSYDFVKFDN